MTSEQFHLALFGGSGVIAGVSWSLTIAAVAGGIL
jgi:hypothetical protein